MSMEQIYSHPLNIYSSNSRRQRGGGFFGKLARMAVPLLKRVGTSLGQNTLGFASNTLSDLIEGKSSNEIKEGMRKRGAQHFRNVVNSVIDEPKNKKRFVNKRRKIIKRKSIH